MKSFSNNKIYDVISQIVKKNISDIHLVQDDKVYFRTNAGVIGKLDDIICTRDELRGFLHDFMPVDKLDELMEGNEVDGTYTVDNTRLRVNVYLDKDGIRLAMRKISAEPPTLTEIGFDEQIGEVLLKDKGLILVTGPTGSGKSTTLASMVNYINENRNCHILTLEDPVEYIFEKKQALITQREIGRNTKTWTQAMKYALRQDPDVIMVGEMRDLESIAAVLTLVETGHLVLSTIHTIDAAQTITRIIDVFPPFQQEQIAVQLSLSLEMVISQRLLPTKDGKSRVAAREILVNTDAIAHNIRERKIPQVISLMETGTKFGMTTMTQSLAELVARDLIDESIVFGKIKNMDNFRNILSSLRDAKRVFTPVD